MTKTATTRLGLSYGPSNAHIRTVNAPTTPVCGVAHGVNITLGDWQEFCVRKGLGQKRNGRSGIRGEPASGSYQAPFWNSPYSA
ncbi:hypothetical protein MTR67_002226, partial [Solanum verrucosum]